MKLISKPGRIVAAASLALVFLVASAIAAPPKVKKHVHNDGHSLSSAALKQDGMHQINKKGKHTVTAETKNGKIKALHVKHDTKGDVAVKKYRKKGGAKPASTGMSDEADQFQQTDMGTVWVAYAYVDDDGNEEYYWYPAEEIYDADTGAVDYVPLS